MPSTSASRRRVCSYRRAFSIAPATRLAAWTRKSESASVNSRGASACSEITPTTSPALLRRGTATIDWYCSSSASGHDLGARVGERALGQEHGLVVLGDPPREALAALEPQPVDQRPVRIGDRPQDERGVGRDQVDEAGVAVDRIRRPDRRSRAARGRGRASTRRC